MRLDEADTLAYSGRDLSQLLASCVERTVVIAPRRSEPPPSEPSFATLPPVTRDAVWPPPRKPASNPWTIAAWAMFVTLLVGIVAIERLDRRHAITAHEARELVDTKLPLSSPMLDKKPQH
jgi:hypothetical protein